MKTSSQIKIRAASVALFIIVSTNITSAQEVDRATQYEVESKIYTFKAKEPLLVTNEDGVASEVSPRVNSSFQLYPGIRPHCATINVCPASLHAAAHTNW